jgi:nucleotide-binding universal stress UspA family protein
MKCILVAYEQRPVAPRVLERSAELARLASAHVIVTSVTPVLHMRGMAIDPVDPPERHHEEVDEALARLRELGVDDVEGVPTIGDTANAILDLAAERDADLIVLGAHDGGALSRLLAGSPGDAVVHRASTDVLIVR